MTKAKMKKSGDMQVTMTAYQFSLIYELLEKVDTTQPGFASNEVFRYLEDLKNTNDFDVSEKAYSFNAVLNKGSLMELKSTNFTIKVH